MYFILITQLLMNGLSIGAEELYKVDKNANNHTKLLPYTLKTDVNKEASQTDKEALSLYEEKTEVIQPPQNNSWKRLTSFLSTRPTFKQSQHPQYSASLFGSFNFFLAQTAFLLIHLAVFSCILFGSATLFHRLLSFPQPTVNTIDEGFNGQFYKTDF